MNTTSKEGSLFELDGVPKLSQAFPLALQHVVAMIVGCVTPAIIISGAAGLETADRVLLIQASLVVSALATLLQLFPIGKKTGFHLGAGLPVIIGVSFAYVPSMQAIADQGGIPAILGAQIVGGCCGSTPEHIRELAQTVENTYRELAPQEPDHFAAAIESESFFLGDDISLSEPLECSYDLGDDLIDIEDEQVNAALVEVNSIDDAKLLIENASMTRLPIVVRIHNLDVLEYTLRNFQGRLIVDSACDLEEEEMRPIVDYYGAILY